eukprot:COSAG05_NODE_3814_length_1825_cov_2.394554_1_plen_46_part_00
MISHVTQAATGAIDQRFIDELMSSFASLDQNGDGEIGTRHPMSMQ